MVDNYLDIRTQENTVTAKSTAAMRDHETLTVSVQFPADTFNLRDQPGKIAEVAPMNDHARSVRRFAEELAGDLTRRGFHADGLLRAREDQPAAQAQEPERHGRRQQHQKGDAVEPGRLAGLVARTGDPL